MTDELLVDVRCLIMRNRNGKNRNGKKAAAARRKGAVAMSVRARFVEAETLALKRENLSFVEIAAQITRIGRSQAQARTPMRGVTFPADFKISAQACHLAYHRVLANEPLMEIEALRKEQSARCESFIAALRDAIENGDTRAIRAALKALEHQARLFGAFQQPEAQVEINVAALMTLDLNTLKSKEREALMIRLFELDGLPIEVARRLLEDAGLDDDAPPEPHSAPALRALPTPEEPITIEEARRLMETEEVDDEKLAATGGADDGCRTQRDYIETMTDAAATMRL